MCTADNGVGKAQNRKTHLNIEFSPKIKVPSPRIPQALYHEALLSCEIKASPSPVMYWKKNNKTIDNDANHQISHFALADEMTVTKLKVVFSVSWYTFVGDKFTFKLFNDLLKCHFNKTGSNQLQKRVRSLYMCCKQSTWPRCTRYGVVRE